MATIGDMCTITEDHDDNENNQLIVAQYDIVEVLADPVNGYVYVKNRATNQEGYIPQTKLRVTAPTFIDVSDSVSNVSPARKGMDNNIYSVPAGSVSDQSAVAQSTSNNSNDSGLGLPGNRESVKEINMSGEYLKAAVSGDIQMLIELGTTLDDIDLATLETARSLFQKPEQQGAKAIVELAINNKKLQDKQEKAEPSLEINKQDPMTDRSPAVDEATKKSKNDEYLQAALKGEALTLLSLKDYLKLIDLDTLEMAQTILQKTKKEEAKVIVELAMKEKQDQVIKESNKASKQVASELGSTGNSVTHDPVPKANEGKSKNDEYLEAALNGDTMKLLSLKKALDLIDIDTLEMAQSILNRSGKDDAKVIVEFALKSKKVKKVLDKNESNESSKQGPIGTEPAKLSTSPVPSHDDVQAQKSNEKKKNDEYLQAAIKGDIATLGSFVSDLDSITMETLKLAQGILNTSGKNDAKPLIEFAIVKKNKQQNQAEDKSTEWLDAAMAGDSQTLSTLLTNLSCIKLETLELAKGFARTKGDPGIIAITDYACKERNKTSNQDKQAQGGNSSNSNLNVPAQHGSVGNPESKQISLTLEFCGETRHIEFYANNTKPWREAVKEMSGEKIAYALEEIDGENYSSKICFKDHKLDVFALEYHIPEDDYITFPMDTIDELQSVNKRQVFIDLSCDVGRIYIEVDCSSNQGKQFLDLCRGIHGSSYKNVEASATKLAGRPGERIVFPGYKCIKDDSNKNDALLDDLEDNKTRKIDKGTVAKYTANGGDFVIFTKGNPDAKTNTYIGVVTDGLRGLSKYIASKNSETLVIENVGIHMGSR